MDISNISILNYINNKIEKIKQPSFTTNFEIVLFKAFGETFYFIENLHYYGYFFHYLKNIRKFLIQNGYTTKANKTKYDYIIKNCYKLPFIEDINKNIDKKLNKYLKKKENISNLINICICMELLF